MLVLRNLYTIKILPHSNTTESIGKYKKTYEHCNQPGEEIGRF